MNDKITPFWAYENGTGTLWIMTVVGLLFGLGVFAALFFAPKKLRKPIVATCTFVSGLYFVLHFLWPKAQDYKQTELPRNGVESVSFFLQYSLPTVSIFVQVLAAMLLGLGISSLMRIHIGQIAKKHKDAFFSITLIVSMVAMLVFGLWDWQSKLGEGNAIKYQDAPLIFPHFAKDLLFDGLMINLDAVMFSIIAFFIFSAAYRAFRVRSVESTILLSIALIVMLSLMGVIVVQWDGVVNNLAGRLNMDPGGMMDNFRLTTIKSWIQDTMQIPSIRAMDFGLAVGGLAVSLRIWLSIEKGVSH